MSNYPHEIQPKHTHPVPKGGSKTEGLKVLGGIGTCWCGKVDGHVGPHAK